MITFDKKIFKANCSNLIKADTTARDRVQSLIEMGLSHYVEHQDTVHLTTAMQTIAQCKSLSGRKAQLYIQHVANVAWKKNVSKDKTVSFVFKKSNKLDATVNEDFVLNNKWFNFSKDGEVKPDMDVVVQCKALLTRINNALDNGTCKQNRTELEHIVDELELFTA